jgi:hypothetical protein
VITNRSPKLHAQSKPEPGARARLQLRLESEPLQILVKMLPSFGLEHSLLPISIEQPHPFFARSLPDVRDLHSHYFRRNRLCRREEQFVVVSSVQRDIERDSLYFPAACPGAGDRLDTNFGSYPALLADMFEVGGKPVADVDHGRRNLVLAQPLANKNPRLGAKMS